MSQFYDKTALNKNSSQDYLNSSQTEKSWLNNSLNEKNYLNSSLNLPPEQRYQSLNEMVVKIIEDDFLAQSANSNMLNFSLKQSKQLQQQPIQLQQQYSQISQQDSKSKDNGLNDSFVNKFTYNQFNSHYKTPKLEYQNQKINNNNNNNKMQQINIYETMKSHNNPVGNNQNSSPIIKPKESQQNNLIYNNINTMPLAFPSSFSHQLATLSIDQQNYLLQQQRLLVMALAATEQQKLFSNTTNNNNDTFLKAFISSSSSTNSSVSSPTASNPNKIAQNYYYHHNPPPLNQISNASGYEMNYNQQQQFIMRQAASMNLENKQQFIFNNNNEYLNQNLIDSQGLNLNPNFVQITINNNNFNTDNNNNDKFRLLAAAKQPYRHHRRTGPANELHVRLEECSYQFKCIESERKKIESELYHININKRNNNNYLTNHNQLSAILCLPQNPSRVDRLIVDSSKEHSKVLNLIYKMDNLRDMPFFSNIQNSFQKWLEAIHLVYSKRQEELINSANRRRINGTGGGGGVQQAHILNDENDVLVLANALNKLAYLTSKARTALWCCLQIFNVNYKQQQQQNKQTEMALLDNCSSAYLEIKN